MKVSSFWYGLLSKDYFFFIIYAIIKHIKNVIYEGEQDASIYKIIEIYYYGVGTRGN